MILLEKSESLRRHLREGNSRNYSTAPAHRSGVPGNQDAAANVGDGEKKKGDGEKKNRKRKCVSILHIAEQSITNFNGDGGEHSLPEKRRVEGQKW